MSVHPSPIQIRGNTVTSFRFFTPEVLLGHVWKPWNQKNDTKEVNDFFLGGLGLPILLQFAAGKLFDDVEMAVGKGVRGIPKTRVGILFIAILKTIVASGCGGHPPTVIGTTITIDVVGGHMCLPCDIMSLKCFWKLQSTKKRLPTLISF